MAIDVTYAVLAAIVACIGASTDVASRRIPNVVTYPSICIGVALHAVLQGKAGAMDSLGGLLLGGGVFFVFFLVRAMGAGDVKLMAAVCSFVGIHRTASTLIACALAGGVFSVFLMLKHRRVKTTLANVGSVVAHHATSGLQPHPEINLSSSSAIRLPYGLAIAAGAVYSLGAVLLGR